jgi:hypothetical protein
MGVGIHPISHFLLPLRPYVMLKSNEFEERNYGEGSSRQQQNAQFEGFCIDLLMELAEDLGLFRVHPKLHNPFLSPIHSASRIKFMW